MATARIPVTYPLGPGKPHIPVTITNPLNNKRLTLNLLVDTGWEDNRIDLKYGTQLGFNIANAVEKQPHKTIYGVYFSIGNLRPIISLIHVGTSDTGLNVFGALPMRQYGQFIITKSSVTATDSATGGTSAGLTAVRKDWNKYIHTSGLPVLAQKQALFVSMVRGNSQAYWRNRI